MSKSVRAGNDDFAVDSLSHLLSGVAARSGGLLKRLGRLETRLFADRLGPIRQPVYVAGLARSGSTLLLEMLDWHPEVVTHRYRDFPLLHVPVFWNRFLEAAGGDAGSPRERAHRDGILITRDSPEAFEEVLWMSFFPHLHDAGRSSVLDASTEQPEFESFYRDHIRKLLMLRGGSRYVSKGNYNVTRLEYLLRIFPDARFVVPVRNPVWHVASLIKQQKLFLAGQADNPRALAHLQRAGHFEFGQDRRVIHTGDDAAVAEILACWQEGREVEGWARYWAMVYGFVIDRLQAVPELAEATLVLPYEALCREPARTAEILFEHCALPRSEELLQRAAERVRFPDYYTPDLTDGDRDLIARVTRQTTQRLREYTSAAAAPGWAAGEGMQIA